MGTDTGWVTLPDHRRIKLGGGGSKKVMAGFVAAAALAAGGGGAAAFGGLGELAGAALKPVVDSLRTWPAMSPTASPVAPSVSARRKRKIRRKGVTANKPGTE